MSSRTAEAQEAFLAGDIDRTREAHNLPVVLLNSYVVVFVVSAILFLMI